MSDYESTIWKRYQQTMELRRAKKNLLKAEYLPIPNYSTPIAPIIRGDEMKSIEFMKDSSSERSISPKVEEKARDEVISSEESDWNADVINYDDLSVLSTSSDDELDEEMEIRPSAGTATEETIENLHQLKHNDVSEIPTKLISEDVIASSSSSNNSVVLKQDSAVQVGNSTVQMDAEIQVDVAEQAHSIITGGRTNRKPKRSSGGKASKCKISKSVTDTINTRLENYKPEVAMKSRKKAKQITKPVPSSTSFYNVHAWNDDVIIRNPKRFPDDKTAKRRTPERFDDNKEIMGPKQSMSKVEIVSPKKKMKQILDVYMNDANKVSMKPSPFIGGASSYINRQVKQRETDRNNYKMTVKLIKVKSAISTFR